MTMVERDAREERLWSFPAGVIGTQRHPSIRPIMNVPRRTTATWVLGPGL